MLHVCVQSAYLTLPLLLTLPLPPLFLSLSPCIGMPQHKQPFRYSGLTGVEEKEGGSIKTQSQSQSASSCAFSFMSDVMHKQEWGGGVPPSGTQYSTEYSNWHSHSSSACWYSFISLTERFSRHFGVLWSYAMSHQPRRTLSLLFPCPPAL